MDFYLFLILLILPLFFMVYTFRKYHDDHRPYKLFQMIFCITLFYMSGFLFISDHEVKIEYVAESLPFTQDELRQHIIRSPHTEVHELNVTNATSVRVYPSVQYYEHFTYNWTQENSDPNTCNEEDGGWYTSCTWYRYHFFYTPEYIFENSVQHTTTVIAEPHIMFIFGTMYTGLGTLMIALTIGETFSLSYWALTGKRDY